MFRRLLAFESTPGSMNSLYSNFFRAFLLVDLHPAGDGKGHVLRDKTHQVFAIVGDIVVFEGMLEVGFLLCVLLLKVVFDCDYIIECRLQMLLFDGGFWRCVFEG